MQGASELGVPHSAVMSKLIVIQDEDYRNPEAIPETARTLNDALVQTHHWLDYTPISDIAVVPASVECTACTTYESVLALPGVRGINPFAQNLELTTLFAPGEPLGTIVVRLAPAEDDMDDIGVFELEPRTQDAGSSWLRDVTQMFPNEWARTQRSCGKFCAGEHSVSVLDAETCAQLCKTLDAAYATTPVDDLKVQLQADTMPLSPSTQSELSKMVHGATQYVLRRTVASGAWIPFHTDVADETVQVPLQSDVPGAGGQLVFLHAHKPVIVDRRAGIPVYHEGTVLHGVTAFHTGVRYALYALRTSQTTF